MSDRPPLPTYGAPPPYGHVPPPGGGGPNLRFLIQLVLGFLGTLAYGTVIFFLVLFTALSYVPQIITELIFGGAGLGVAIILFVTLYFRWWGVLAGAALAFLVPVLLVGACAAFVVGISIFSAAGGY